MTAALIRSNNTSVAPTDLASLDLENFDALIAESAGQESLAMREDYGTEDYDNSWKAHVTARINSDRIRWEYPTSGKEREELERAGGERHEEVTVSPEHYFVGLRGIPIDAHYGFAKKERDSVTGSSKTLCRTTALIDHSFDPAVIIKDNYPLEIPINQIHQNKDNPNSINTWLANRPHLELMGSLPPIGTPEGMKTSATRSCKSCVEAGEHYSGTEAQFLDPSSQIPVCRADGFIYFCVMQLAVLDSSKTLSGGSVGVKWVSIEDAMLMTERDGQLVQRKEPFILKIAGMTKVQHWSIGTGQFERNVIRTGKSCYLPDNIYSWGDYLSKYLNDRKAQGRRLSLGGRTVYPVVTELFTGKLKAEEFGSTHIPVFSPVTDPEVIDSGEGLTSLDWLKTALQCFQYERALVNGTTVKQPAIAAKTTAAAIQPTAEPTDTPVVVAAAVADAVFEAPKETPGEKATKAKLTAFSGPKASA